jgi:hypothetical protein
MEVQVIKQFKEKFIKRKDIGSEYFEGNYKSMIDIIYSTVTTFAKFLGLSGLIPLLIDK